MSLVSRAGRGRAALVLGCVLLALGTQPAVAAIPPHFALRLDVYGLRQDEVAPLQAFLGRVEAMVPPRLRAELSWPIRVSFAPLDEQPEVAPPPCPAGAPLPAPGATTERPRNARRKLGETGGSHWGAPSQIRLHRGFVRVLVVAAAAAAAGTPGAVAAYPCGHRSLDRLAAATLLHELMHVLDWKLQLSRDATYREIHAFPNSRVPGAPASRNVLFLRSPDATEFESPSENLSINFEYYMLDPEYQCRRPLSYQFFEQRLRYRPFPGYHCRVRTDLFAGPVRLPLDPRRVYQVHFLFAARGDEIISRWGHAMFRLVVCSPERETVDERCLEDLQHHVVLTFAANLTSDVTVSTWKGLTGAYPSQLFVKRFPDVLIEYTELELRDLESLPLRLSAEEKERFLLHALEQFWGYSGRYYFLANNCATEAMGLLQVALRGRALAGVSRLSPLGLKRALVDRGVATEVDLRDPERAEASGLLFRSLSRVYEPAFQAVRRLLPQGAPRGLARYIDKTRAAERRAWFLQARFPAANPTRAEAAAQLLALENLIWAKRFKALERRLPFLLRQLEKSPQLRARLQPLQRKLMALWGLPPWQRMRSGYGIPLREGAADEAAGGTDDAPDGDATGTRELEALTAAAIAALRAEHPEELREIEVMRDNRVMFQKVILDAYRQGL